MNEDASMFDKDKRMLDGEESDRLLDDEVERFSLNKLTMTSCGRCSYRDLGEVIGRDEDMTPKSTRSRSPYGDCDLVMMVEAEPDLVGVPAIASGTSSTLVSEPKPFGKPERFTGDEKHWAQ